MRKKRLSELKTLFLEFFVSSVGEAERIKRHHGLAGRIHGTRGRYRTIVMPFNLLWHLAFDIFVSIKCPPDTKFFASEQSLSDYIWHLEKAGDVMARTLEHFSDLGETFSGVADWKQVRSFRP